jgi:hypothetical protein
MAAQYDRSADFWTERARIYAQRKDWSHMHDCIRMANTDRTCARNRRACAD